MEGIAYLIDVTASLWSKKLPTLFHFLVSWIFTEPESSPTINEFPDLSNCSAVTWMLSIVLTHLAFLKSNIFTYADWVLPRARI